MFHNRSYANRDPHPFMLAAPRWQRGQLGQGTVAADCLAIDQSRLRLAAASISVAVAGGAAENPAPHKGLPWRQAAPQLRMEPAREHVPIPRIARRVGRTSEVEAEGCRIRGEPTGGSFQCELLADVEAPTRPRPYRGSFPVLCRPSLPRARWGMSDRRTASPRSSSRNGSRRFSDPCRLRRHSSPTNKIASCRPPLHFGLCEVRSDRPRSCRQPSRPRKARPETAKERHNG